LQPFFGDNLDRVGGLFGPFPFLQLFFTGRIDAVGDQSAGFIPPSQHCLSKVIAHFRKVFSSTDSPNVSIIIVNCDTKDLLRDCLRSVIDQTKAPHEIIVIGQCQGILLGQCRMLTLSILPMMSS